jgi:DNA-binding transcriptional ArsR family regulator
MQELEANADRAAGLLKAMANRHRLMILCELHRGECSVGTLERAVGLSQSALSQHLARLRADGLVKTRREAQTIHYALAHPGVTKLMATLYELYCGSRRRA